MQRECGGGAVLHVRVLLEVAEGGGQVVSLSVDVSDRAVKLMSSEDGKLRIDYYESEKTSYDISLSEEGVLSVTLDLDQSWTDFVGGAACGGVPHGLRLSPAGADRRFGEHDQRGDLRNGDDRGAERIHVRQRRRSLLRKNRGGKIGHAERKEREYHGNGSLGSWDDYAIACNVKKGESSLLGSKEGGSKTLSVDCNNGDVEVEIANA